MQRHRAGRNAWTWMVLSLAFLADAVWAAACISATPACSEWVTVGDGAARVAVYRTHPIDAKNDAITRALVVVHGQGRTAGNYFRYGLEAASLAHALESTLIVSPRFASREGRCRDTLAPQELNWVCDGPQSWRNGGPAIGNDAVTSYDVADAILERLARRELFPNLKLVVFAGHSAGGQFTTRYAMANQLHDRLGVPVTYVVANPSSYTYLDSLRPNTSAVSSNCAGFDSWPYGLQGRTGYSARLTAEQLKKQLAARPTTYLLGELDVFPVSGFDASCPAMAQGPTRLARGLAYGRHVTSSYGAQHRTLVIPACGHSARCMFTAERALPLLFP